MSGALGFGCGATWPNGDVLVPPLGTIVRRRRPDDPKGEVEDGAWLVFGDVSKGCVGADPGLVNPSWASVAALAVWLSVALIAAQPPRVAASAAEVIMTFALATPATRRLEVRDVAIRQNPFSGGVPVRTPRHSRVYLFVVWLEYMPRP